MHSVNLIQRRVDNELLRQNRGRWVLLAHNHVPLFPNHTIEYLRELTYGTYQLYLSPSYIQDTLMRNEADEDEEDQALQIDLNTNELGFIRIRLYSRFRNATRHQLWISYNQEYVENQEVDGNEPILGYYCTCKAGARTLGTCSHVAAVLWFLGWARNQDAVKYHSTELLRNIIDARNINDNPVDCN